MRGGGAEVADGKRVGWWSALALEEGSGGAVVEELWEAGFRVRERREAQGRGERKLRGKREGLFLKLKFCKNYDFATMFFEP